MKKLWFSILSAVLLIGCGQSDQPKAPSVGGDLSGQVVNGVPTKKGARPYMAFIKNLTNKNSPFGCGGAVLARQWILTAAHCTYNSDTDKVTVLVASLDRTSTTEGEVLEVEKFYNHPKWKGNTLGGNDISLIKLAKPITHPDVKPIGLPSNEIESILDVDGQFALLVGWGLTKAGNPKMSIMLNEVSLPIEPNPRMCSGNRAPKNSICTPVYQDRSACSGDSGSPLAREHQGKWYVLGTVSYGLPNCKGNNTYMRVNGYLDWIKETSGLGPGNEDEWGETDPPKEEIFKGKVNVNSSSFQPNGTKGFEYSGGLLKAELSSSASGDFDLYLQKKEGVRWVDVGSSTNEGHNESLNYNAAAGKYRWEVYAYEGSGEYTLKQMK